MKIFNNPLFITVLGGIVIYYFVIFVSKVANRRKFSIKIEDFSYSLVQNNPYDNIVIITPYPSTYLLEMEFSNDLEYDVTVKDFTLEINNLYKLKSSSSEPIRVGAKDIQKREVVFPVEEKEAAKQGYFRLVIQLSNNRHITLTGDFPIKKT